MCLKSNIGRFDSDNHMAQSYINIGGLVIFRYVLAAGFCAKTMFGRAQVPALQACGKAEFT